MILYSNCYSRNGNDAILVDMITLNLDEIGLYLDHKKRWRGCRGNISENYTLELDVDDVKKSQEQIDLYLKENGLDVVEINLEDSLKVSAPQVPVRYNENTYSNA